MAGQSKVSGSSLRSSQWITDLSKMADEVRDRTLILKIKSQLHPWSDLDIRSVFSEFGMIEEVKILPSGSRFHSQIIYQTEYDREWACYYYQDGCFVHQNCCEIQVYRADDIISWNAQRIDKIRVASVVENEPIIAMKSPVLGALKVFDKLPKSHVNGELILRDEIANINKELIDGLDWGAKPMSSIEDRDDVKYVKEVYFDPGGTDFDAHQMFDEMPTLFISKEVRFPKEIAKINAIVVENEQVIAKETSVFSAYQVLGKMSKSYVKEELILLDEIAKTNENLVHGTDWEATPVGLFERLDDVKVVEEVCFDPGGTSLLQHSHLSVAGLLEETVKDDELMNQEGHSSQSAAKIKSNSAKEPSCLDALNVLDEMPRFIFSLEVKFSADIAKINDKFVNGHDLKAPPSGSVERLANVTAPKEGTPRDAIPTNPALKVGFSAQARMISENVYLISFDPGGSTMTERGNAFSLSYVNCENGVSKVEKSAQIEKKNEHEAIKELVHFAAHQMLDEMPKSMKCCELELFDEFKTVLEDTVQLENRNPTVQGTPISRNEDQDNSSIFKASIFMQLVIIAQVQCLLVHILGRIQLSIYAANFKGHGCATWRCLIS